jgi:hypothetical protein
MKMRRAIAGVRNTRLIAEGDGFALLVTAIGVAAIAGFKLQQRQMARIGFDAAELDGLLAFENRHDPSGEGSVAFPQFLRAWLVGGFGGSLDESPGRAALASPNRLARPIVALRE